MQEDKADRQVREQEELASKKRAALLGFHYVDSRGWSEQIDLIKDVLDVKDMYSLHAIPVVFNESQLIFAITVNTPQTALKELKERFPDYNIAFWLISESGFKELMRRHDPPEKIEYKDIDISAGGASDTLEEVSQTLETVRADDILDYLIRQADRLNASDIHFENEEEFVRMRFRIDGTLHQIARLTKDKYRQLSTALAIRANVSVNAPEAQTGRMSYVLETADTKKRLNMRIETVRAVHGQDVVIRVFNVDRELMKIDKLGFSPQRRQLLEGVIRHPHGMVLVVGPTGSGKTTTLYSILDKLNTPTRKIVTLEDPVEYNFNGVTQIPVNAKSEDNLFADNLRAVLRLDPDVVMIGEIRDVDTAKTALQAALTGHLVLSTFHAANAASALTRMLDIIGENPLFAGAIRLVLAQRLVRRLDDNSKQAYVPDERLRSEIAKVVESLPEGIDRPDVENLQLYRPGKTDALPFGYSGRIMIAETLVLNENIQDILRREPSKVATEDIQKQALADGMVTLLQDGILKAVSGLTTIEEVYRSVDI